MSVIQPFLDALHPGPRQSAKALTLWPLLGRHAGRQAPSPGGLVYAALSDALEDGLVRVSEVSEAGSVPHVRVENRAAMAVLVLFGEEIRGAKQNRVANASFLLPAHRAIDIDVSCVEQGRWGRRAGARDFGHSADLLSSALRRKMGRKVRMARELGRHFDADQGEVWQEVSQYLSASGVRSRTAAYADYADSRSRDLDELCSAFRPVEGQRGFVASIGDEVVGLEAIGDPVVFARVFPKLLRSYAIDAVDSERVRADARPARFEAAEPFLRAVAAAPVVALGPSLGLGDDIRLRSQEVEAAALAVSGEVVHLSAFPAVQ